MGSVLSFLPSISEEQDEKAMTDIELILASKDGPTEFRVYLLFHGRMIPCMLLFIYTFNV